MYYKFKRLTIFIAFTGALFFAGLAGYEKYLAQSSQSVVDILDRSLAKWSVECADERTSLSTSIAKQLACEYTTSNKQKIEDALVKRDEHNNDSATYLKLSIAIPFICTYLWFGCLWVAIGRFKPESKR